MEEKEGFVKLKYITQNCLITGKGSSVYDIDIAPDGKIYIADFRHNKVLVFDSELNELFQIKEIPSPHSVSVDNKGFLYVAAFRDGHIRKFDPSGEEIMEWDKRLACEGKIQLPISLDTDKQNNILIADYGLQTVLKVSETGEYLNSFDVSAIMSKGEFLPHDVTTDEEKYVYIADRGADKSIQVFTLDGKYAETWPKIKDNFDPLSARFLSKKLLLVPNYKDSKLYLFDIKARHLETFGKYGKRPGEFLYVTNLAVDKNCYIYTVEEDGNRVQKLDFSGIVEENLRKRGQ